MLKSLIFLFLSGMTFSAHAQNRDYNQCMDLMEDVFLASEEEADTVCSQNSSPSFLQCMYQRAKTSNIYILDAAPLCSEKRLNIPVEKNQSSNYVNTKSCPAKLQIQTKLSDERADQICKWDSSDLMQNCILDLVKKANFHNEHAIQYCGFAGMEYRKKIPNFVACVIDNARKGFDVYSNVKDCDNKMFKGIVVKPQPRPETRPEPQFDPNYPVQPAPPVRPQPEEEVVVPLKPEVKTGGRKVPTPVEIKIENSSTPEVTGDTPVETGSTSNSEALPL